MKEIIAVAVLGLAILSTGYAREFTAKELDALQQKMWEEVQQDCRELEKEGWNICDKDKLRRSPAKKEIQTGSEIYREAIGRNPY